MMQFFFWQCLLFSSLVFLNYSKAQDTGHAFCNYASNYTSGSAYEKNLNLTLSSLATKSSPSGYLFTSQGQNRDVVYGLFQCTSGISTQDCQTCVNNAASKIIQTCSNQKEASIYYDNCLLQFSYQNFYLVMNSNTLFSLVNAQEVTDPVVFNSQLGSLVKSLSTSAASSFLRSAVGSINYTDVSDIYAMMQCTRDLSVNSCLVCLQIIASQISNCCGGRDGAQVISWSCKLRFEIYVFFQSPLPPPPPPAIVTNSTSSGTSNSTSTGAGKKGTSVIVLVVIPLVFAFLLISTICFFFLWRKTKRRTADVIFKDGHSNMDSLQMDLNTIKVATRDFFTGNKLGEGGFGPVYKGTLSDGREIAVKRLSSNSGQGLGELRTEVMLVAKLMHRNLVRLLGFCLEEEEKLLVYEYLPNGSLDKILYDERRRECLGWEERYKIIFGIARGLLYLHEDSLLRVIHRDLKASNILLDESMSPKISDFGLARLFCGSQTQGSTNRIAGTYGYMAPEYIKNGCFSTKSDVYSFGILALQIVTGRKNSFNDSANLQTHVWQHWINGTALELLDPTSDDQWPRCEALNCLHIALLCVQEAAADRPTISEIVLMLSNSYAATALVPSRPAFLVPSGSSESDAVLREDSDPRRSFDPCKSVSSQQTVNDLTISEIIPR